MRPYSHLFTSRETGKVERGTAHRVTVVETTRHRLTEALRSATGSCFLCKMYLNLRPGALKGAEVTTERKPTVGNITAEIVFNAHES